MRSLGQYSGKVPVGKSCWLGNAVSDFRDSSQPAHCRLRAIAGFTMAELLVVVAILAVLMAIAGVAIFTYWKNLTVTEYDNSAKAIYIAAQNNISDLQASGEWAYNGGTTGQTAGCYTPQASTPIAPDQGLQQKVAGDATTSSNLTYYYITASAAQKYGILPAGTVEETVRSGAYIIEYCYETASVYGVFYTKNQADQSKLGEFYASGLEASGTKVREQSVRADNNPIIGYYGGASASDLAHVTLENPVVSAGYSPNLAVTDPNLKAPHASWKTSTLLTLTDTTKLAGLSSDATSREKAACSVTLVLTGGIALAPTVTYVDSVGKIQQLNDSSFCQWATDSTAGTYSINLTQMKANSQLASLMTEFEAGHSYSVVAKVSSSQVLCRTAYGYGDGVWPSNDDVVFTSNIIADYEDSADVYLYTDDSKGEDKSELFAFNLENYFNNMTLANETLYYKVNCTTGISFNADGSSVTKVNSQGKPTSLTPDANGYYAFDDNTGPAVPASNLTYHHLGNIYVEDVSTFTKGTITVEVHRQDNSLIGKPTPATDVAKTLTINVHVMNSKRTWNYDVKDHGSYADVVITAGAQGTPGIAISTSAAVANWTDSNVAYRSQNGQQVTVNPVAPGGSTSVRFLKTDTSVTLTKDNFTVTPTGGGN